MRPTDYLIVTEVNLNPPYEHRRVFRVPIDGEGCYKTSEGYTFDFRSRRSINAFFHSKKKRNYKNKEILYHSCREDEHIISENIWRETYRKNNIPRKEITYIDVDSIWDFYTLIGYDYKNKKYL